ncbi:cAMP phosphodiesterases class-II-domain-containing protein [Rhizoctonia solani]|nr:cAMP phosphodiesterases class-II-domain-containing protein [Rhizoctonia solani]
MSVHSRKKRRMDSGHFDLVVVGCGGGHDETNLSGYLLKPRDKQWSDGILGIEAGSGYGALKQLFESTHPHLFASLFRPNSSKRPYSATDKAHTVFTHLRAYLISHAHLDHCASLIISSGSLPGPTRHILGTQSVLEDLERCIWRPGRCWPRIVGWDHDSSSNTAGGILRALKLAPGTDVIGDRDEEYAPIGAGFDDLLVRVVPVSHGCSYTSSAFFIRHARTRHEFLFFGDVEADPIPDSSPAFSPSSSSCSSTRPLLFPIWTHAAHLFTSNRLRALMIECSYPAGRSESQMFGHLSVDGLRKEIQVLAAEVAKLRPRVVEEGTKPPVVEVEGLPPKGTKVRSLLRRPLKRKPSSDLPHPRTRSFTKSPSATPSTKPVSSGPLTGLRVIVTHCKEPPPGFDLQGAPSIADYIVRQLKYGVGALGPDETGVEYIAAHQGDEFGTD